MPLHKSTRCQYCRASTADASVMDSQSATAAERTCEVEVQFEVMAAALDDAKRTSEVGQSLLPGDVLKDLWSRDAGGEDCNAEKAQAVARATS